jgi:hypothetical protein
VKVKDQYVVLAKGLTQGQAEYVFVKLKNLIEGFRNICPVPDVQGPRTSK